MPTLAVMSAIASLAGILIGLGVGWGVMKSTVKDLTEAVRKLDQISTAVTILQTQHTHSALNLDDLIERVHALEITVARANLGGQTHT